MNCIPKSTGTMGGPFTAVAKALAALALFVALQPATAATAVYDGNGISAYGAYNSFARVAQQFQTDATLTQLTELSILGSDVVAVYTDVSDAPGADLGVTFLITSGVGFHSYVPAASTLLQANSKYWIVQYGGSAVTDLAITGSGFLPLTLTSSDFGTVDPPTWVSDFGGSFSLTLRIFMDAPANAVPEPSTWLSLALGLVLLTAGTRGIRRPRIH